MASISPVLAIGTLYVTPYSLIIFAGALAGVILVWRNKEIRPLLPLVILGAVILGHVFWVLFCPPVYVSEEGKGRMLLRFWEGGYTLYGALAGGALAAFAGARILRLRPLKALDGLAPGACAALIFARVAEFFSQVGDYYSETGVYFAGQGFGDAVLMEETPLPFPLVYCTYRDEYYTEWRVAVWFWEAVAALVILAFLLGRIRKAKEGQQTVLFVTALGCSQILLEQFRRDDFVRLNPFVRFSQLAALVTLIAVLAGLLIRRKPRRSVIWTSSAVLVFAALAITCAEFAFDKPQYYLLLYISMGLTAVLMTVQLLMIRKARGLIAAVPVLAISAVLCGIHMAGQWEEAGPLLYGMMAVALVAIGIDIYLTASGKRDDSAERQTGVNIPAAI